MARFYAQIQGDKGKASRRGHKASGIWGHIRGWHKGIEVDGYVDEKGYDRFRVFKTGGSITNIKRTNRELIAEI